MCDFLFAFLHTDSFFGKGSIFKYKYFLSYGAGFFSEDRQKKFDIVASTEV